LLPSNAALVSWGQVFAYSFSSAALVHELLDGDVNGTAGEPQQEAASATTVVTLNDYVFEQSLKLSCSGTSLLSPTYGVCKVNMSDLWAPLKRTPVSRGTNGELKAAAFAEFPIQAHTLVLSDNNMAAHDRTQASQLAKTADSSFSFSKLFTSSKISAGANQQGSVQMSTLAPVSLQLLTMNMVGTEADITKARLQLQDRAQTMIEEIEQVGRRYYLI
jgi:hypothetical protein